MSLRMNLNGWSLPSIERASGTNGDWLRGYSRCLSPFVPDALSVLGSRDSAVLEAATARLTETFSEEFKASKAKAWLRTLIESGYSLRQHGKAVSKPADGGLLTVPMETELHVFVVAAIARALARPDHLDLSLESSYWNHNAVGALYRELSACRFVGSKGFSLQFYPLMGNLSKGLPLFGDDFRTSWSFYSVFGHQQLGELIPILQAAADFKRTFPAHYPEAVRITAMTELSADGKKFIGELIKWFTQIHERGQDAFILW